MIDNIKTWFSGLENREQLLIGFGAVFLVVFLGYMLVIEPMFKSVNERAVKVENMREDLAMLQRAASQPSGDTAKQATAGRSLVVVVEQSATAAGLKRSLTGNQPQQNNVIRVNLKDAPFNAVVSWLAGLGAKEHLFIQSANIKSGPKPGTVTANVTLVRPAS